MDQILSDIGSRLPEVVQDWFRRAEPEIGDTVRALAKVDGIEVAAKEVMALYVAWLEQPHA